MSNLLRGHVIGLDYNNDLVYVESYDNNGVLDIRAYTCIPVRVDDMESNSSFNTKFGSFETAPFFYKHDNDVYAFALEENELDDLIRDLRYCFHKDALFDLYNSFYANLLSTNNKVYNRYVDNFKIAAMDYYFPEAQNKFIFDKMLNAYFELQYAPEKDFSELYKYSNGAELMDVGDKEHILFSYLNKVTNINDDSISI